MSRLFLLILSLTIICVSANVSVNNPFYCYTQDPIRPQIKMFAKISAYETSRGRHIETNVSTCTPSKIFLVNRHGTRLPKKGELTNILEHNEQIHKDIVKNYDAGRSSLCASDMALIRYWRFDPNITLDKDQYLTTSGWDELQGIAKRYQEAFPTLLPNVYSPNHYFFRVTNKQRTLASIRAFADGLFGFNGFQDVFFEEIPKEDVLLRPQDHCQLFIDVTEVKAEQDEFVEGPEYQQMVEQVSAKLGFHGSHVLRKHEVDALVDICKYEQIWNLNVTSPLCAAFSIANHQVLEFYEDLEFYYQVGYGNAYRRLIENINCHLMQEMLRFLRSNDPNEPTAKIFGTHSTTLLLLLVTFGSFEDEVPLTRHNFAQQTQRLYKTSLIAAMASNLAVIRYDCDDGDNDILFMFNEKPLLIPGCQSNGVCKQSFIFKKFSRFVDGDCSVLYCSNTD